MAKHTRQMRTIYLYGLLPLAVCFAIANKAVLAQQGTIPQLVADGSFNRTRSAPSGKSPTLDDILKEADLVVRGTVGESRSYLSSDNRDVYTDYSLLAPVFLYQRTPRTTQKPGQLEVIITQLGGKVMVGNVEFTQTELGLPPLKRGTEAIFILEERENKYHIARAFYGAFGIVGDVVKPLTPKRDFAPEYREMPVAAVLADLTSRVRSVK